MHSKGDRLSSGSHPARRGTSICPRGDNSERQLGLNLSLGSLVALAGREVVSVMTVMA